MPRPASKVRLSRPIRAVPQPPGPGDDMELAAWIRTKRKENLRKLQKIQDDLIERLATDLPDIKPRELLYNLNIANDVTIKMSDRDVPTPATQQGAHLIVAGLSREEAIALLAGHRDPDNKKASTGSP